MSAVAQPPDLLALGGGGILGEAWMTAVLAGIEEAGGFDALHSKRFVGTSAGSIVATALAGGIPVSSRVGDHSELPSIPSDTSGVQSWRSRLAGPVLGLGGALAAPVAALALYSTARPGAVARRAALGRVPAGKRSLSDLKGWIERVDVDFDGRLLIAAVDRDSGRRMIFGSDQAPAAPVADAVLASCAIPGVFRPVEIAGRSYVDGGAWSPTNMDAVSVARGDRVMCLNPTGSLPLSVGSLAGALGPVSRSIAATEALSLRHRGAQVKVINPDVAAAAAMGVNLMSPDGRADVTAAGLEQGWRLVREERD